MPDSNQVIPNAVGKFTNDGKNLLYSDKLGISASGMEEEGKLVSHALQKSSSW